MYLQKARILEDRRLIESALESLNDIIFIIEQKFGKNNKILFECNKKKAKLVLMISRHADKNQLKEKQHKIFKINTTQKRVSDNGALVFIKNNKSLNIQGSKRKYNQKLNKSNREIGNISRKAMMLIVKTLYNPDNIIPITKRPTTVKKPISKNVGGKSLGRSKFSDFTNSSQKLSYKNSSSSHSKMKTNRKNINRYEKFVPISLFTQQPVTRAIYTNIDLTRSHNQSDNASKSLFDAQKQLIDHSSIFNQETSMNLLNRPLNDEEIKQIIKNRVRKTIEAVDEVKREKSFSRYSNGGSLPQDYCNNHNVEKPKLIDYVPKTENGNEFERQRQRTQVSSLIKTESV